MSEQLPDRQGQAEPPSLWADLPRVLFVKDLMVIFGLTAGAIVKAFHRGEFGPYFYVGIRLAVLRDSLLATIKARQITPSGATPPPTTCPTPDREFLEKIQKGKPRRIRRGARRTRNTREGDEDSQSRT